MLASLVLLSALTQNQNLQEYIVQRDFARFDSKPLHQGKERVTDPNDPTKTVEADVEFYFDFGIEEYEDPEDADDYEHFRTVRVRPESPARPFQMMRSRVMLNDLPWNQREKSDLSKILAGSGMPRTAAQNVSRSIQAVRQAAAGNFQERVINVNPNEGVRGGGWTVRDYGYDIYVTSLHMQLKKKVTIPGREPTVTNVGESIEMILWEYWIPVPMTRERFIPDAARDMRSSYSIPSELGGVKFNDEYATLTGIQYVGFPRLRESESLTGKRNFFGTISASNYTDRVFETLPQNKQQVLDILKLSPNGVYDLLNMHAGQGSSMNSLRVPGDMRALEGPNCGSEMVIPPGTAWIPDTAGYQTMSNTIPINLRYSFDASIDGAVFQPATMRTHCLNMDLKEPAAGVRYFPFMSNDDVIVGLMDLTSKSNFRGPWDQVRTWIYTDKVSLTDANKRIDPPIAEGQYANGLFDVFRLGGLTKEDLANKKFFEPILLASAGTSDQAFGWLSMHMGEKFGKDVRAWISSMPSYLTEMVTAPETDSERTQPTRLLSALLASLDTDTRIGALTFLDKLRGGEASLKGKLGDFETSLHSMNAEEAALAAKVAPRYAPVETAGHSKW